MNDELKCKSALIMTVRQVHVISLHNLAFAKGVKEIQQ